MDFNGILSTLPSHPQMSPITGFSVNLLSSSLLPAFLSRVLSCRRDSGMRSRSYVLYKTLKSLFKLESFYLTTKSPFHGRISLRLRDPEIYKNIFIIP